MRNYFNIDESNLSITVKMEDLKALFCYWQEEWAKKLAEANKLKEIIIVPVTGKVMISDTP